MSRLLSRDPALFCQRLEAALVKLGCKFIYGDLVKMLPKQVNDLGRNLIIDIRPNGPQDKSTKRTTLFFENILIAAGPWSVLVADKLGVTSFPFSNLPGHSLLIRPALSSVGIEANSQLPAEAVFAGISGAPVGVHASTSGLARSLTKAEVEMGFTASPELFPRMNGLVYVAGENSIPSTILEGPYHNVGMLKNRLPERLDGVSKLKDEKLVERLTRAAGAVSSSLMVENGAVVVKSQVSLLSYFHSPLREQTLILSLDSFVIDLLLRMGIRSFANWTRVSSSLRDMAHGYASLRFLSSAIYLSRRLT